MNDPHYSSGSDPNNQSTRDAWREVGRQFQTLGDSISSAFRAAWTDDTNRQRVEEMRSGIESMVNKVGQTLKEYGDIPEAQQFKEDTKRAAENLRSAGEQTMSEARPHLVAALRQVNAELQRMIDNMDNPPRPRQEQQNPPPPPNNQPPDSPPTSNFQPPSINGPI